MKYWPAKSPDEVADYRFDWSAALQDGESIASHAVTAEGVTVDDSTNDADSVTVWLSGGAEGTVARVTSTIVTDSVPARTFDEVAVLPIGGCAVGLARAKQHLRVEHDEEDELIGAYVSAAVDHVESVISKCLTPKVVRQVAAGFPGNGRIRLYKGPVQEVLAVEYDDANGAPTALADFRLVEGSPAVLMPVVGEAFPATYGGPGTVRIDLLAGYQPGEMPRAIETAVLQLTAHYYANREAVVTGTIATEIPLGVQALLRPHRPVGLA